MSEKHVTLTPLGGLGEIGQNCTLLETEDSLVVIDCGLMFPDELLLGVDVVIPCLSHILEKKDKLKGIVLTHGHEDHIGALPWLMPHLPDTPLFSSRFTLALIQKKLQEYSTVENPVLCEVKKGERIELGDFAFTFLPVCHSIIEGFALGIETPVGKFIHTGDFKLDPTPLHNQQTDLQLFADFAKSGVKLLMSDSTNIEREGRTLTESDIENSLNTIFKKSKGRILITLFSSHIQRIQEIFDLAAVHGRKVGISGRSLANNVEIAKNLGYLNIPPQTLIGLEDINSIPDEQMILLLTGSQGEPLSALTRLAYGEHRNLSVHAGDTVIMSSRIIPGNTRAITKVINQLYRKGAEVLYDNVREIHASGHAHKEELRQMIETVRPQFFLPVHGEYRHLVKHSQLAKECGVMPERSLVIENGQPLTFTADGLRFEEQISAPSLLVDGKGVGDVGQSVLRERQILGDEGLVIILMALQKQTNEILIGPKILSKGFIFEQQCSHILDDARSIIMDIYSDLHAEPEKLQERIHSSLRRFFRKELGRDPVIVPLVIAT